MFCATLDFEEYLNNFNLTKWLSQLLWGVKQSVPALSITFIIVLTTCLVSTGKRNSNLDLFNLANIYPVDVWLDTCLRGHTEIL